MVLPVSDLVSAWHVHESPAISDTVRAAKNTANWSCQVPIEVMRAAAQSCLLRSFLRDGVVVFAQELQDVLTGIKELCMESEEDDISAPNDDVD